MHADDSKDSLHKKVQLKVTRENNAVPYAALIMLM